MAKGFFRELKHYSIYDISKNLNVEMEEAKRLIGILKRYGIIKAIKGSKPEYEDLSNQDIVLTDVTEKSSEVEFVFDFVGVVMLDKHVFKCYPKYIVSTSEPLTQLKQILQVIKKYNSKQQLFFLYNGEDEDKIFNRLAVSLYLLDEYFKYGVYTNQHEFIETNGEGEILWDKTIDETFTLIQNNRPYYIELQTKTVVDNEMDYFRKLHECILSTCSKELREAGILELFDITEVDLCNTSMEEFGDLDYILYRLQKEIQIQYVSRKQRLLKTIYTYLVNSKMHTDDVSFSLYGTNSFNLVWEKVCSENFGSMLDYPISKLPLGVSPEYEEKRDKTLRSIIDKPIWHRYHPVASDGNVDVLRPDMICIYPCNNNKDYCFGIYDAKYYRIDFIYQSGAKKWKVIGQPGVSDVTKQYLYQLAYNDFIVKQGYKYIQNMFFCPQEEAEPHYGYVEMKMFNNISNVNLEKIAIVKLCAQEMFLRYLDNNRIDAKEISNYIPQIGYRRALSENFTSKMLTYLKRMKIVSSVAEDGLEMEENKGKVIYPSQITRELGAKIIYDTICPIATMTIDSFHPYEKVKGSLATENGNTYRICSKLADVSLKIEGILKELSEQELKDWNVMKEVLKKCFGEMKDINTMVEGKRLDQLTEIIMELAKELYL